MVPEKQGLKLFLAISLCKQPQCLSSGSRKTRIETVPDEKKNKENDQSK